MPEGSSNGKYHPAAEASASHSQPSGQAAGPVPGESSELAPTPDAPASESAAAEAQPAPLEYACPSCGFPVPAPSGGPFITCPVCGQEFMLPAAEETSDADRRSAEDQLDSLRVQGLTRMRRASIRSRSWLVVGCVGCIAVAGELIRKTVIAVKAEGHLTGRCAGFIACAVSALLMAVLWARRAAVISRELARPLLEEPSTPPDFSTLSDGSQHWKNLDKM